MDRYKDGERQSPWGNRTQQSWEDVWQDFRKRFRFGKWFILGIVLIVWLATGIYTVGPGEQGVVRQFGRFVAQTGPGLNYRLPWPIQAVDIVDIATVRRVEVGFRTRQDRGAAGEQLQVPEEALMLTGDKNIANVQILVLYQVEDPVTYLFCSEDPAATIHINTEIALRSVIGNMNIDHAMTVGRPDVETGTWEMLQRLLDDHCTGLHVVGVELQAVDPPDEVREAFYDVVRAKADRERLIREAQGYALDIVPRARGEAAAKIHEATGYKSERIAIAEGNTQRFLALLVEYQQAPAVTRQRLYLEMVERVFPDIEKIIIEPQGNGSNLLQFLPLKDFTTTKEGGNS